MLNIFLLLINEIFLLINQKMENKCQSFSHNIPEIYSRKFKDNFQIFNCAKVKDVS